MPSHGALSKAGKVRHLTPKKERQREKRNDFPRKRNWKRYKRRILLGKTLGQSQRRRKGRKNV